MPGLSSLPKQPEARLLFVAAGELGTDVAKLLVVNARGEVITVPGG